MVNMKRRRSTDPAPLVSSSKVKGWVWAHVQVQDLLVFEEGYIADVLIFFFDKRISHIIVSDKLLILTTRSRWPRRGLLIEGGEDEPLAEDGRESLRSQGRRLLFVGTILSP